MRSLRVHEVRVRPSVVLKSELDLPVATRRTAAIC